MSKPVTPQPVPSPFPNPGSEQIDLEDTLLPLWAWALSAMAVIFILGVISLLVLHKRRKPQAYRKIPAVLDNYE